MAACGLEEEIKNVVRENLLGRAKGISKFGKWNDSPPVLVVDEPYIGPGVFKVPTRPNRREGIPLKYGFSKTVELKEGEAVIHAGYSAEGPSASGELYYLKKDKDKWIIDRQEHSWMA